MEVEIEGGLRVKINQKDNTSSVIGSPKAKGTVLVPRFAEHDNIKYKIISISGFAFSRCYIDLLTFPEDSEIEFFDVSALFSSHIKKLKIPPKLKRLGQYWCRNAFDLREIEMSPENPHFIFYNNEFLLGKSREDCEEFDVLHFASHNIEKAEIPAQVRVIKEDSFNCHRMLKLVSFPANSELKVIENYAFNSSSIRKLDLPASLERLEDGCFSATFYLNEIKVSPENKIFKLYDNKYLVKESRIGSGVFDVLVCAVRSIEIADIPSHIKVINNDAFAYCKQLKAISFAQDSSLEVIKSNAFYEISGPERIVLPPSVKEAGTSSFASMKNVKYIEFLGKSVRIGFRCFGSCSDLLSVTFPNAENVTLVSRAMTDFPAGAKIRVKRSARLDAGGAGGCQEMVHFIDDESIPREAKSKDEKSDERREQVVETAEQENDNLKKFNRYLAGRLSQYEEVPTYEEFVRGANCRGGKAEEVPASWAFIGADDEEFQEVVCKIGEGATSEVFKVSDKRTGDAICKKVIKECADEAAFKTLQNSFKEIQAQVSVVHPCVCRALGCNTQEEIPRYGKSGSGVAPKTTVALFFELLPYSVKAVAKSGMLNNTLKTRIALEVAFGMSHIHALGMMHRDLKIDNVMMNCVFESKIIDFGLAHIPGLSGSASSLTTGIGTLDYMSPEMLNAEEYDAKTDVYSYGIVLFALFTGDAPRQKMRDRMNNAGIEFPEASPEISEYCIDLIRRCTSFEASQRPTFDEIIDDMAAHSFCLASEVDKKVVLRRFQELDGIRALNSRQEKVENE